jgi:hypothetical protein
MLAPDRMPFRTDLIDPAGWCLFDEMQVLSTSGGVIPARRPAVAARFRPPG